MRIWLDPSYLAQITKDRIQSLVKIGNTLVTDEGIVDMTVFQENPRWTRYLLEKEKLVIETNKKLDEFTAENVLWFSCGIETPAYKTFEDAIVLLPNANGILEIAVLLEEYSSKWTPGPITPPPLSIEECDILWVDHRASRPEIYKAAVERGKMYIFDIHNKIYVRCIAKQHYCDAMILADGTLEEI